MRCQVMRYDTSPGVDGQKGLRLQLNSRQSSTVDTSIPFSTQRFEYSTEYSTYNSFYTLVIIYLFILTSDEEVSPEAIYHRVSTTRNTQYSDVNTSIEYSSQYAIRVSSTRRNTQMSMRVSSTFSQNANRNTSIEYFLFFGGGNA
eukprot:1188247-Prorocentrum_minimum.AAC.3